jgi:3-oxoadipate enol-lactonase
LPTGRHIELPGRGTTFYREVTGPEGAPVVILLHGWTATADLNFFTCYEELGQHFRVIAIDHRGHGRGIRSSQPFRLADCADDVAALADALNIDTFIPVGYSMGGTIAQLMWKRHEQRVSGLVLAATSGHFASSRRERTAFHTMAAIGAVSRIAPKSLRDSLSDRLYLSRKTLTWEPWAAEQAGAHEWRHILEAGATLGNYDSRSWLPHINVPTAVIMTTADQVVHPGRQQKMVDLLHNPTVYRINANHDAVFARASEFVPLLINACNTVITQSVDTRNTIDEVS